MSYVPVIVPPPAPSPRAQELGRRLEETIDRFRQEDPAISPAEIQQAVSLAAQRTGSSGAQVAVALAVAFLVFGIVTFLYFLN